MEQNRTYGNRIIVTPTQEPTDVVEVSKLIETSGLKHKYIAEKLQISSYATYLKLMSDLRKIKIETLTDLAGVLKLPVNYLFACVLYTIEKQQTQADQTGTESESPSDTEKDS